MVNIVIAVAISIIVSYLLGCIPSAFLIGRAFKGIDIRQVGSHNMGAMNTFYAVGFWPGMLVLALDICKGIAAILLGFLISAIFFRVPGEMVIPIEMACGVAVIAGHNFPAFLKFKGGKGGATSIGVLVSMIPWINVVGGVPLPAGALVYLGSFLLLFAITRWATFAYGLSFIAVPLVAWFGMHDQGLMIYSICIALVPILMYIPRIKEIYGKYGGNIRRAIFRKDVKERV